MKYVKNSWRVMRCIPRVLVIGPLLLAIKVGEVAEVAYWRTSKYLPGLDGWER